MELEAPPEGRRVRLRLWCIQHRRKLLFGTLTFASVMFIVSLGVTAGIFLTRTHPINRILNNLRTRLKNVEDKYQERRDDYHHLHLQESVKFSVEFKMDNGEAAKIDLNDMIHRHSMYPGGGRSPLRQPLKEREKKLSIKYAKDSERTNRFHIQDKSPKELPPNIETLLRNITGSHAASGVNPKSLPGIHVWFMFQLLPHLMKDKNSLHPSFHMRGCREFVDVVIGVPTVKRDKKNYLIITIMHLMRGLTKSDLNSTLIIIMVGETDLEFVIKTAMEIEMLFFNAVNTGLIEIISPSPSYYPDFDALPMTLGDSKKRTRWRSKHNLDELYLMAYAQSKGTYYLMLEDDILIKPRFLQTIKQFTAATTVTNPGWMYIEFCPIGGIGKLFRTADLGFFMTYIQLFYNNMPIDWLLDSFITDKVCAIEKNSTICTEEKAKVRPKHPKSLFQHIGVYSTLKGKVHKVKLPFYGHIPTFYPHKNPPLEKISSDIEPKFGHTIEKAYEGQTFFWGDNPRKGNIIEFTFGKPVILESYMFRSSNVEYTMEKFYGTVVEVLTVGEVNYTVVGEFDEFGMAEDDLTMSGLGPVVAIRLRVGWDSMFSVILSEIELKTMTGSTMD